MTFIGIRALEGSADVVTDSWSYTPNFHHVGHTSKVHLLPHVQSVLATAGNSVLASHWHQVVDQAAHSSESFDELRAHLPDLLKVLHDVNDEEQPQGRRERLGPFLIGYSPSLHRFCAVGFIPVREGWEDVELTEPHVQPHPRSRRLSGFAARQTEWLFDYLTPADAEALCADWRSQPAVDPSSDADWIAVATAAREECATAATGSGRKVLVGGCLFRTTLTADSAGIRKIHQFTDDTATLRRIFRGTSHPIGQMDLCPCGSGDLYRICCMLPVLLQPCGCGSDVLGADCCAVPLTPEGLAAAAAVTTARW